MPGSFIDQTHPEGLLGTRYFRGSGTSEATAITSGAIALILQKYPTLTPDQVKRFIANNGQKVPGADSQAQGGGEINLPVLASKTPTAYTQSFTAATGTGTLELSRGTDHLTAANGVVLTGEQDIFGHTFTTAAIASAEAAGSSWDGGTWNGSGWTGSSWTGSSWDEASWNGPSWAGTSWNGSWASNTWSGSRWSGSRWSGSSWSGSRWSGGSWASSSWT